MQTFALVLFPRGDARSNRCIIPLPFLRFETSSGGEFVSAKAAVKEIPILKLRLEAL